jgi:hypothetical protein
MAATAHAVPSLRRILPVEPTPFLTIFQRLLFNAKASRKIQP